MGASGLEAKSVYLEFSNIKVLVEWIFNYYHRNLHTDKGAGLCGLCFFVFYGMSILWRRQSHPIVDKTETGFPQKTNLWEPRFYHVLLQYQSKPEPAGAQVKLAHSTMLFTEGCDGLYPQTMALLLGHR